MNDKKDKESYLGPVIVASANAMRAFDAPVRNPMLISVLPDDFFWNPAAQNLTNALRLSSFSSFVVGIEHIIGAILITPFILVKKGWKYFFQMFKTFDRRDWFSVAFVSLGSGLGLYFFLISFALGNPTVAILLQKSQPLITLFVAMLVLKERPSKYYYIAAIIAIFGIFLISLEDILKSQLFEIAAAFSSLIAAFFWGSNTVFGRILTDKADYWDITAFRYV
ncbi:MAG: DMT family transporter [Candidatus Hodarchaeales archaeon]